MRYALLLLLCFGTALGVAQVHDEAKVPELHYQCAVPGPGGEIVYEACGPAVKPAKAPPPISAIAVSKCGMAVSLFIQLDADHLLHADPKQSEMFTNVNGKSMAAPMPWKDAYALAQSAVLTSHVMIPCDDRDQAT